MTTTSITELEAGADASTNHFLNQDDPLLEYRGIPTIGALGPIPSRKARVKLLSRRPERYDPSVCNLPPEVRAHAIRFLSELFIPTTVHDRAVEEVDIMLRAAYARKNPISPEYRRQMNYDLKLLKGGTLPPARYRFSPLLGLAAWGPPGVGKTTVFDLALSQYPSVVEHLYTIDNVQFAFTQVVALKINMFQDASLKAFGIEFFEKLAALVQEPDLPGLMGVYGQGFNANTAQPRIHGAVLKYHLGLLIIDDSQNAASSNRGFATVFDYFIRMMNCLGLPVILIGTDRTAKHLASDLTFSRRFIGNVPPFKPFRPKENSAEKDGPWEHFFSQACQYQYIKTPFRPEPIRQFVWEVTGGVPDLVIKLLMLSQTRLIGRGNEILTVDTLAETANELFSLVGPRVLELRGLSVDDPGLGAIQSKFAEDFRNRVNAESQRIGAGLLFPENPPAPIVIQTADFGTAPAKAAEVTTGVVGTEPAPRLTIEEPNLLDDFS